MAVTTRILTEFMPLLMPNCPACPEPVAEQALRLAAAEFCERTRCWRHITERTIRRSESCIVAPEYATIHEIENASFDGLPLTPTQFSDVDLGAEAQGDGTPQYITQSGPDRLIVMPFREGRLTISLFLKPRVGTDGLVLDTYGQDTDDPANQVPEFLFTQHAETLVNGALWRILSLPGQPYSNPTRAAECLAMFERKVDGHFAMNIRGQHRAPARSRPVYF